MGGGNSTVLIAVIGAMIGGLATLIGIRWQMPRLRAEARKLGAEASRTEWQTFGELNAVLLLDYREAGQFTSHVPLLDTLTTHRGFAFLTGYKKKSRMLMLAGRDPTAVADVVARLATMKSVPPNGVIFTID